MKEMLKVLTLTEKANEVLTKISIILILNNMFNICDIIVKKENKC